MAYSAAAFPSQQFGGQSLHPQEPTQAVVGLQFCAPAPVAFFLQDKLSWSRGDATILDGNGAVAFSVKGDAMSWKGNRVLKDTYRNTVCSMQLKSCWSLKRKWVIYRGDTVHNSATVASVTRGMMHGMEVRLPGSDEPQYTIRHVGYIGGKGEVDIMHNGCIIAQAKRQCSGEAYALRDRQSYHITISPGYDHAFLLCVIIVMDQYYREENFSGR